MQPNVVWMCSGKRISRGNISLWRHLPDLGIDMEALPTPWELSWGTELDDKIDQDSKPFWGTYSKIRARFDNQQNTF